MVRDMELIRRILKEVQARTDLTPTPVAFSDVDPVVLAHHVEMLVNEKLIDGMILRSGRGGPPHIVVTDLSWSGHDLIAALGDEGVWAKMKSTLSATELVTLPLVILKEVGIGLLKGFVQQKFGLSS